MKKRKKKKLKECVYCGKKGQMTRDHIPPKLIFPSPRPSNLITVPCCHNCNKSFEKDDEFFRLALSLPAETYENPAVQKMKPIIFDSLRHPNKAGLRSSLIKSIKEVELVTKSGLYLGKGGAFEVDLNRLDKIAARIVKGLFFCERGHRLPDDYICGAFSEKGMTNISDEMKEIVSIVLQLDPKVIHREVFQYQMAFLEDDPNYSAWILTFYKAIRFLCITVRSRNIQK